MWDYLIAMTAIPLLMASWLLVQWASRKFAEAHPEFGPPREEGGGCGKSCSCSGSSGCNNKK